jgi:hypothetical protein
MFRLNSSPMMSCTSPPEQNARPAPCDYHNAHSRFITQSSKRIRQLAIDFKRQRIEPLGTVQCDRRDALFVLFVEKRCWLFHAGRTAMPSISTFARRRATCNLDQDHRREVLAQVLSITLANFSGPFAVLDLVGDVDYEPRDVLRLSSCRSRTVITFASARSNCSTKSSLTIFCCCLSQAICPAIKSSLPGASAKRP